MSDWMKIVSDFQSELMGWEKDLFAMPELGFKESGPKRICLISSVEVMLKLRILG
jgi:metal-dependent amidase/aminoacylase/carboxypeptidase family protein